MEQFLKFLKIESVGGHIIRFSLIGLLLFGGFTKLILIGAMVDNLTVAILVAAIETFAAFGLLIHFRKPIYGVAGGILAILSIFIRLVFSLGHIKENLAHTSSFLNTIATFLGIYNNGLFHILLLFGAALYCLGNSYKAYVRDRITQPWPH